MSLIDTAALRALRLASPETAHGLAIRALRMGLVRGSGPVTSDRLASRVAGLDLPNPIGLAAGFDKNAEVIGPLSRSGFGFIEAGAVTPRAQPGNPKPRLFRLTGDRAAINRFGFNNEGIDAVLPRLARRSDGGIVGLNLGANKDSTDRARDFATVLEALGPHVDFATVNVSSPNTEALRDLQGKDALGALLRDVMAVRGTLPRPIPVFVKIAPDLTDGEIDDIAEVAMAHDLAGIIATNTTLSRDGLRSPHRAQAGGLSGAPLFERSTDVLRRLAHVTEGRVALIGVGGVETAEQAYAKLRAGASAVQLYTALVYRGIGLAHDLPRALDRLLARDGVASVTDVIGADIRRSVPV
ncbi:MAG: quinone-dependent dihydroorotate dehydrogenase [Pseudomonadota bacterium]